MQVGNSRELVHGRHGTFFEIELTHLVAFFSGTLEKSMHPHVFSFNMIPMRQAENFSQFLANTFCEFFGQNPSLTQGADPPIKQFFLCIPWIEDQLVRSGLLCTCVSNVLLYSISFASGLQQPSHIPFDCFVELDVAGPAWLLDGGC